MIEENQIGQNKHKSCVRTLTEIVVWMVDNMHKKLADHEALKMTNTKDMGLLSDT